MKKINIFNAFTLAEVLITLGIIGVIAALTIPNLMNKTNDKETVVAVKKAHSILSQAYMMAVQENGTPDTWSLGAADSSSGAEELINKLAPYIKVTKNCGASTTDNCTPGVYKYINGNPWGDANEATYLAKAQMADGMILLSESYGNCTASVSTSIASLKNVCGDYRVDINGLKKPNQFGVDLFIFHLTKTGIVPMGTATDTSYSFDNNCKNKATDQGRACAAWVIYNENMDYLHCGSDLSWTGKTKCN